MTDEKSEITENRFVLNTSSGIKIDRSQEEGEPLDIGDVLDGIEDKSEGVEQGG